MGKRTITRRHGSIKQARGRIKTQFDSHSLVICKSLRPYASQHIPLDQPIMDTRPAILREIKETYQPCFSSKTHTV